MIGRRTSGKANSGSTRRRSINEGEGGLNARYATWTARHTPSWQATDPDAHLDRHIATCQDLSRQVEPWKMTLQGISAASSR